MKPSTITIINPQQVAGSIVKRINPKNFDASKEAMRFVKSNGETLLSEKGMTVLFEAIG